MEHELERFVEDVAHIKNELENEVKDKERYGKPAGFLQSFFVYMVCKGPGNLFFSLAFKNETARKKCLGSRFELSIRRRLLHEKTTT